MEVEKVLRTLLSDPEGVLFVDEQGPHWKGSVSLQGLSYSNTDGWGVVICSRTHSLGVDVERWDRPLKKNHLEVAKRFFHAEEFQWIQAASPFDSSNLFMDLWMKKEAASKLMRVGLARMIGDRLPIEFQYRTLEKVRDGYRAWVAIQPV